MSASGAPGAGRRFVVSEHTVRPGDVHWDLMVEDGPALVTFQLAGRPATGDVVRGRRIADHRLAYLEYEGPVSNDRGAVAIRARGRARDLRGGPRDARWRADLEGEGALAGVLEVEPDAGDGAVVVRVLPPGAAP